MRKLCLVLGVLLLPLPASAQHSWSLPAIGLPPPPRVPAVQSEWRQRTPWEQMQVPVWEKRQLPPWERQHGDRPRNNHDRRRGTSNAHVVYVPYAVAYQQEPQVIIVQQPPITRIVRVEVPAPAPEPPVAATREAEPPPAPYVPSGDRTVYVIPGCYVGNVSPVNMKLPANCDITKLTTYVP